MRLVPTFAGSVDDAGLLVLEDARAFARHIARFRGYAVRVTVRRASASRSLSQNRRLWALYGVIAEWSGHDPEEIHEAMKAKFLSPRVLETPRGPLDAPPSTKVLSVEDFGLYMNQVEAWAIEQGCVMPDWTRVA